MKFRIGSEKARWAIVPIGVFLLLIGTLVEILAISFSVTGLDKLFPMPSEEAKLFHIYSMGFTPIMIAAGLVEFSKLGIEFALTAMKNIGHLIPLLFRLGLRVLQLFLILITGLGIYGFYTQQFIENNLERNVIGIEMNSISKEIENLKEEVKFRNSERDRLREEEQIRSREIEEEADKEMAKVSQHIFETESRFDGDIKGINEDIKARQKGSLTIQARKEYKASLRKDRDERLDALRKDIIDYKSEVQKLEQEIKDAKAEDGIFIRKSDEVRQENEPKIDRYLNEITTIEQTMEKVRKNYASNIEKMEAVAGEDRTEVEREISALRSQKTSLIENRDKELAILREDQKNITLAREQKLTRLKEGKQEELDSIFGNKSNEEINKRISDLKAKHLKLTQQKETMKVKIGPIAYVAKLLGLLKEGNTENVENAVQVITIVWATLLSFFGVTMMRLGANVLFMERNGRVKNSLGLIVGALIRRILRPKKILKEVTKEIPVPVEVIKEVPVEKIVKVEVPIAVPMSSVTNAKMAEVEGRIEAEGKL